MQNLKKQNKNKNKTTKPIDTEDWLLVVRGSGCVRGGSGRRGWTGVCVFSLNKLKKKKWSRGLPSILSDSLKAMCLAGQIFPMGFAPTIV